MIEAMRVEKVGRMVEIDHEVLSCHQAWWEGATKVSYGTCWCGCGKETSLARRSRGRVIVKGLPVRFVNGHNMRSPNLEYAEEDRGYRTPCWIWQRCITRNGYGQAHDEDGKPEGAHRHMYKRLRGEIPRKLQLHHLCEVRACVNPRHLEPVTHKENVRRALRKTHCHVGHPFEGDNLYVAPTGHRVCRECDRLRRKRYRKEKREKARNAG